ncbi:uncharacterized protein LOC127856896 [Dreissena polymorpha]|uniref:Cysteine and tyrosine-rich protein 1 n=1 Tax=Dreissena polymorpha TaxID=45954 RepID=A0A9D3YZS1_DREPO|nr:uncharacterized protein LOC127856896 [Dreissena polymorpha]KAH3708081.1 hypothetical protein DPMN_067520 [Dreissena polymorpha]
MRFVLTLLTSAVIFTIAKAGEFCTTDLEWRYCYDGCCSSYLGFYSLYKYCCTDSYISGGAVVGIIVGCICAGGVLTTLIYYFVCYRPNQRARVKNQSGALPGQAGNQPVSYPVQIGTEIASYPGQSGTTNSIFYTNTSSVPPPASYSQNNQNYSDPLQRTYKGVF